MSPRNQDGISIPQFVALEGVDGVGKSTVAAALEDFYRDRLLTTEICHTAWVQGIVATGDS